jgi:hypothetical protein
VLAVELDEEEPSKPVYDFNVVEGDWRNVESKEALLLPSVKVAEEYDPGSSSADVGSVLLIEGEASDICTPADDGKKLLKSASYRFLRD